MCVRCNLNPIQGKKHKLCHGCYQCFMRKKREYQALSLQEFVAKFPSKNTLVASLGNPTGIIVLQQLGEGFIAHSPKMLHLVELIKQIAPTKETVLLTGETGTGKGIVAREIHNASERRAQRFVTVDCTGLSEHVIESELFGHLKGAFTGAIETKMGLCEFANGGTLFLDEIAELPFHMQSKLLHMLEERRVRPVGGLEYRFVDIRVIAATNQKLDELVVQKRFRSDLFFRLNVLELPIPPLRERAEEIPFLIQHFGQALQKLPEFSEDVLALLSRYEWPGNIRELRNVIHRCAVLATGEVGVKHLPERFVSAL
ncbi:MAG: sigma-54 dependent transcriptional regulator [Patescibacteria group bacterium]